MQDFIIREMRSGFHDVNKRLDDYNETVQATVAELKQHVISCERRHVESEKRRDESGASALIRKNPILAKLADRGIDYAVFTVVLLCYYALTHGAHLPVPQP